METNRKFKKNFCIAVGGVRTLGRPCQKEGMTALTAFWSEVQFALREGNDKDLKKDIFKRPGAKVKKAGISIYPFIGEGFLKTCF